MSARREIHHEVRGSGPALLLISGGTGDAGNFTRTAEILAGDFTTICYDRRGCSRSARVGAGEDLTVARHARDAAALIEALGLAPVIVFGTSGGGDIALEMVAEHWTLIRGAVLHEPVLLGLMVGEYDAEIQALIGQAANAPEDAMEGYLRLVASDATVESLDADLRERVRQNGAHFFSRELDVFASYVPAFAVIRSRRVPLRMLVGVAGVSAQVALAAEELGVAIERVSGSHCAYLQQPESFAEELRPVVRDLA
jgi:pimeloyl-ACP methyl ester carboxylesterase